MNAPLRITIDDATKRKADCWERAQEGELSAHDHDLLHETLYRQSQVDREISIRLETMSRRYRDSSDQYKKDLSDALHKVARHMNLLASRAQDLRDKFNEGGNAYIMPEDA